MIAFWIEATSQGKSQGPGDLRLCATSTCKRRRIRWNGDAMLAIIIVVIEGMLSHGLSMVVQTGNGVLKVWQEQGVQRGGEHGGRGEHGEHGENGVYCML